MIYLILILILGALIMGPQHWAKSVLKKYSIPRDDLQGTGGELVEHLQEKFSLAYLKLEATTVGDHYDPIEKTVRLSEENLNGRSLTAVAVAAHEFGHAMQDAKDYKPLAARTRMIRIAQKAEKMGSIALFALPLLALSPGGARMAPLMIILLIGSIGINCVVHLITLPVEFDASFGRALPMLEQGQYVDQSDLKAVRKILTACAFTYLAGSLAGLLNFWRWFRFLRR
jgi:uncharacterized protein